MKRGETREILSREAYLGQGNFWSFQGCYEHIPQSKVHGNLIFVKTATGTYKRVHQVYCIIINPTARNTERQVKCQHAPLTIVSEKPKKQTQRTSFIRKINNRL